MSINASIIQGLKSDPKYIPLWFRYDKQGSIFNDRCLRDNAYYYFYASEVDVLRENVKEMVDAMPAPVTLIEMGSGNSEKSRLFIDAILERQSSLIYIPVDISQEFLEETAEAVSRDYGQALDVRPIAGDYSVGIEKLREVKGNKLVIWLGGGFQNQTYADQVSRIQALSTHMAENDRVVIAIDVTGDAQCIKDAYLDPTGVSEPLYLNALWRLNRDYGSAINTEDFEVIVDYVKNDNSDATSYVTMRARAKRAQVYDIPGLGMSVSFEKDECLNFYQGEGTSCKYSREQLASLVRKGGQQLHSIWIDQGQHVALCSLGL